MRTTILITVLALLQAFFFALTYLRNPTDRFAFDYFAWVLIPATGAAIAFAPRFHFVAAIGNAVVATVLFDYLLLHHGYFWPDRAQQSPVLAFGYVVMGVMLAFIAAGFVHAIVERVKRSASAGKLQRTFLAVRGGLAFSAICAVAAVPVCIALGPDATGVKPNPIYAFASMVASCLVMFGLIVSLIVGLTFDPARINTEDLGKASR
ncbi:MAG: hypothetical protein AAF961_04915 [Planctomycetota bacterium]